MMPRGALEVILFAERKFVGSLVFTTKEITIGSDARAQVRLDDAAVSPQHALLHFTGRTCVVEDQGSASGTWVGGKRVESHLMQPIDEIVIGKYSLRVVVHQAEATAPVDAAAVSPPVAAAPEQVVAAPTPVVVEPVAAAPVAEVAASAPFEEPVEASAPAEVDEPVDEEPVAASEGYEDQDSYETAAAGGEAVAAAQPFERAPRDEEEDDDDDEDHDFVPTFSLVDALLERQADLDLPPAKAVVQAVFYRDEFIDEIRHLAIGEDLKVKGCVATCPSVGRLSVRLDPGVSAIVRRRGDSELDSLDGEPDAPLELDSAGVALVMLGPRDRLLLQFVPGVAPLPSAGRRFLVDRGGLLTGILACLLHVGAFIVLGITSGERASEAAGLDINQGRFAMLEMKDPVLEQPKPKPKKPEKITKPKAPPPKPTAQPTLPKPPTPQPTLPPSLQKYVNQRSQQPAQGSAHTSNASANRALDALASLNQPSAASQAVTNLNAVIGHNGPGGFKMNGTIGKLDGAGLRLAPGSSGSGRVDTRGAGDFGKNLGRVTGAPAGSGKVRGIVAAPPARNVEVQGELDRAEILKVVNAHMREVSGCYERRLIRDPSLSGKVILEWVIQPNGNVGVVRVKFSDVKDTEVATCIQGAARGWHFPNPKGGPVTVTFPFVFSTIGL